MLGKAEAMAVLAAEDAQRAKAFYTDKLGLKVVMEMGEETALFEAGQGSKILIYQRERSKAEHTVLGFVVEDVEASVKGLAEKGVSFEQYDFPGLKTNELGIAEIDGTKSAWLTDPEGNIVSLTQMKA